ncbi:MAG: ribosome maturation factor RimM [Alphaproteobacteria bacterium]|nr:ribosome maturation factor RimM [Alphaproteobacteria bacterium]
MTTETAGGARAPRPVCVGVIVGAHGVRGAVRVKSFTADAMDIASYGPLSDEQGRRQFALSAIGQARGAVLARIEGVQDRDAAEALRGVRLYVDRARFPEPGEDEFYHADLIGLAVLTVDGARLGTVGAIVNHGAGDMMEIALEAGGSAMLPFTKAVVPAVDLAGGKLVVDPPAEFLPSHARRTA